MNKLLLAVAMVTVSGCATQSFVLNDQQPSVPTKETMQPFFVSGLGQTQEVDAAGICHGAENVAKVETHMSFLNGVLGALSS
ncbi:MAG: lipoprotein bor, partial [Reinekea sp.]|nr:lipoprotein bor [Reinekea sp.]